MFLVSSKTIIDAEHRSGRLYNLPWDDSELRENFCFFFIEKFDDAGGDCDC